jgi:hypothetical protein
MKTLAILALMTTLAASAVANDKIGFMPSDTTATVLKRNEGQKVELRLKSGEKISGKVAAVGEKAVHISELTGQEFYDAVISLDDVSVVIVRAK